MGTVLQLSTLQPSGNAHPQRIRRLQGVDQRLLANGSLARQRAATNFPLYHRPGVIAVVTTDWDACESLLSHCYGHCPLRVFHSADSFLNCLQQEPPILDHDHWLHRQLLGSAPGQKALIPGILDYWATQPERLNLTRACVVDDLMAGHDGLDILGELIGWRGLRILLTGDTTTEELSSAVEMGMVDRVVAKTTDSSIDQLATILSTQLSKPSTRTQQLWASSLSAAHMEALQSPAIANVLLGLAQSRWVEWACIGEPFGILGLDAKGVASWLQLQLASERNDAVYQAIARGLHPEDIACVARGEAMVDLSAQTPNQPLLTAFPIDRKSRLVGAWRPLKKANSPTWPLSTPFLTSGRTAYERFDSSRLTAS